MLFGFLSGILWAVDSVMLGIAYTYEPFASATDATIVVSALHELCAALFLLIFMGVRGRLKDTWEGFKTKSGKVIALGAFLGGPVAMTAYVISVVNIGAGYAAALSALYPAVTAVLSGIFLGEKMKPRQWIALIVAIAAIAFMGVYDYGTEVPGNFVIGLIGGLVCAVAWGFEVIIVAKGMSGDDVIDSQVCYHIRETASALWYALLVVPILGVLMPETGGVGLYLSAFFKPGLGMIAITACIGAISYLLLYHSIDNYSATKATALNIGYSAWAVFFGAIVAATMPAPVDVICAIVLVVGSVLAGTGDWSDLKFSSKDSNTEGQAA